MLFLVSKKFVVWTDASTEKIYGRLVTTTGYTIKHGRLPPLIGSTVNEGIYNSIGELTAGIDCLSTLVAYCEGLGINPSKRKIVLKTDFNYLKKVIDSDMSFSFNEEKMRLINELKELQKRFKRVRCDEIERKDNIAHNICVLKIRDIAYGDMKENEELIKRRTRGFVKNFYEIYENPSLCEVKVPPLKLS